MTLHIFKSIIAEIYYFCADIEGERVHIPYFKEKMKGFTEVLVRESKAKGANLQADIQGQKMSPYRSVIGQRQDFNSTRSWFDEVNTQIRAILKDLRGGWYNYKSEDREALILALEAVMKPCKDLSEICTKSFDGKPKPTTVRQLISQIPDDNKRECALKLAEDFRKAGFLDEDYLFTIKIGEKPERGEVSRRNKIVGVLGHELGKVCGSIKKVADIWGYPEKSINRDYQKAIEDITTPKILRLKSILEEHR
ncbi:MAG: hypothetical protein KBS73_07570 [Bacteroidales bacterium]|nr:hypothetical protein [Candidatus Cacconaster equifaecalis]